VGPVKVDVLNNVFYAFWRNFDSSFCFAQDNLDVKKVSAPSKNPAKWLIMCFSRVKNIKSLTSKNSGTLIVIMKTYETKSFAKIFCKAFWILKNILLQPSTANKIRPIIFYV
jgi:hypothetical protein